MLVVVGKGFAIGGILESTIDNRVGRPIWKVFRRPRHYQACCWAASDSWVGQASWALPTAAFRPPLFCGSFPALFSGEKTPRVPTHPTRKLCTAQCFLSWVLWLKKCSSLILNNFIGLACLIKYLYIYIPCSMAFTRRFVIFITSSKVMNDVCNEAKSIRTSIAFS